jgi:hypothetical protein
MSRVRTRSGPNEVGTFITIGSIPCQETPWSHNWRRWSETCTDETFAGDGHPFDMTKVSWMGTPLNSMGTGCNGQALQRTVNFVPQLFRAMNPNPSNPGDHNVIFGRPSNGALAAKLLAETSPSRPVVDLPVAIGELRELPLLIRGYGDGFLKALARGNLSYNFGIRPMISDLSSLLDFQDAFASRMRELNALKEGTLRRKRMLFRGAGHSVNPNITINSGSTNGGSIVCSMDSHSSEEVWGFVRWKPSIGFPQTDDALRRAARRAVLGLTVDFSTAWNLIPWSWLVDWSSSAGDYLMSNRNIIPCTATGLCIMSHRKTRNVFTRIGGTFSTPNIGPFGPWTVEIESKTRSPASPTLSAQLPLLSWRQLSILASIGISKYR